MSACNLKWFRNIYIYIYLETGREEEIKCISMKLFPSRFSIVLITLERFLIVSSRFDLPEAPT